MSSSSPAESAAESAGRRRTRSTIAPQIATLVVVATDDGGRTARAPLDVVAQLGQDGRQHRQRADHRDGDHEHRRHAEGRESFPGEEHARHGDDDRRAGDEHRASGCRGGYLERLLGAPPGGALLAFPLQVEHRVVDPDGEPDQENHRVERLVARPDLARDRPQPERREDGRQREQQRDPRRDERPEDDDQDDQRDRDRVEARLLEVVHEGPLELLSTLASPNVPMKTCGCAACALAMRGEDRIDLVDCQVGVAADLEVDERRAAVRRDLAGVLRLERGADVRDRGLRGERCDDSACRGDERRSSRLQRFALDQHVSRRRLLEAVVQNRERAARLARCPTRRLPASRR